jgi:hypothetical protein
MNRWDSEPLWMIFEPPATVTKPEPEHEPDVSPWAVTKHMNRLEKQIAKIESGKWLPKMKYRLNGQSVRALREAHQVLDEGRDILKEKR